MNLKLKRISQQAMIIAITTARKIKQQAHSKPLLKSVLLNNYELKLIAKQQLETS